MLEPKLRSVVVILSAAITLPVFAQTSGGLPPIRRAEPMSQSREVAEALVNQGWGEFIGSTGIVNERRARDLTLRAVDALNEESLKGLGVSAAEQLRRVRSAGLNNLSVFERCALDARIRVSPERQNGRTRQEYKDIYSTDNAIWDIYLKRSSPPRAEEFVQIIRENPNLHPVSRYISKLGGRLPESADEAYRVLEDFAKEGDPDAALWLAFRFECREAPPQLQQAITWYGIAISNYERAGATQRRISSTKTRLQRLMLIQEGKFRVD